MNYLNKFSSLEERAAVQVAINLCQENSFKEVALCLEKPTYGSLVYSFKTQQCQYIRKLIGSTNEKALSNDVTDNFGDLTISGMTKKWDAEIDEQCQKLTEELPHLLNHKVHSWMHRIALEYLSYGRRQEKFFGVSPYFLMNILARSDWLETGRLNEKQIAERLLEDGRLMVLQRYYMACIYCMHGSIRLLWERLTLEEKRMVSVKSNDSLSYESNCLISIWSCVMDEPEEIKYKWQEVVFHVVNYGNLSVLISCWKCLSEHIQQQLVLDMALLSLGNWENAQDKKDWNKNWIGGLLLNNKHFRVDVIRYNLPSYYSELMCFLLSEMNEEQQLTFFKKAFQYSVLECFLDWPLQDHFLPTINRLWEWGIVPKDKYGQCLLSLASKYSGDYDTKHPFILFYKKDRCYDYRNLLLRLWEETPYEYKKYVFYDKRSLFLQSVINEGKVLLQRLLEKSPYEERDEVLFKRILQDLDQEEISAILQSESGKKICSKLLQDERCSFVNWLLKEYFLQEHIPSFKKHFIQSDCGRKLCVYKLKENSEKFLEGLIDWSLELDVEKTQFKYELVDGNDCLSECMPFLWKLEFTEVERMINFCVSSNEMKEQLKVHFAKSICALFIKGCMWEKMDKVIAWSCMADEKIRDFKKDLLLRDGFEVHFCLVFHEGEWKEAECFYKWFCLSPEEIKNIKMKTIFQDSYFEIIKPQLRFNLNSTIIESLRWCLTDEEMVISFKKKIEDEALFEQILDEEREKKAKEYFEYLVSKILDGFGKEDDNTACLETGVRKRQKKT